MRKKRRMIRFRATLSRPKGHVLCCFSIASVYAVSLMSVVAFGQATCGSQPLSSGCAAVPASASKDASSSDPLGELGIEQVSLLFPKKARSNVAANWPVLQEELHKGGMSNRRNLILYALATVRAETSIFSPDPERPSKYSQSIDSPSYAGITAPGTIRPFGGYDSTLRFDEKGKVAVNKHLGNSFYPGIDEQLMRSRHGDQIRVDNNDGERYRGRGFIQLTGKYNYEKMQKALQATVSLNIVDNPDSAASTQTAAKILVGFISLHQAEIENDMERKDYLAARKVVNAAGLGMTQFLDVVSRAKNVIR